MIEKTNIDLSINPKRKVPLTVGVQLSSYDKNFHEFEISFLERELRDDDIVNILTVFESSKRTSESTAEIRDGSAFFSFDTSLIDRNEEVTNYVYLKTGDSQAEIGAFKFDVKLSEIDNKTRVTAKVYDENYESLIRDFEKELKDYLQKLKELNLGEGIGQSEGVEWSLAESDRVANEKERESAESTRVDNEKNREENESLRKSSEDERVRAEKDRVTSENERKELYNSVQQKVENGEFVGEKGDDGDSLEYVWDGTQLGVRKEGETEYAYVDLKGPKGDSFDFENLTEEQILKIRGAEIDTSGFVSRNELSEAIENVDVSDQLDSKADINHTHDEYVTADEVANLVLDVDLSDYYTKEEHDDSIKALDDIYSPINHTHEIDDVNNLQSNLDSKADVDHTHADYVTADEVIGLVPDMDLSNYYTKAEHDESIEELSEVYAPINHTHNEYVTEDEVLDLVPDIDLSNYYTKEEHDDSIEELSEVYSPIYHTHSISDISKLQSELDSKASSSHSHDERYSRVGHTHSEYMLKGEAGTFKVRELTESEYSGLQTKDPNTLYILKEG